VITDNVLELVRPSQAKTCEEYDYYPTTWADIHHDRRRGVGWSLYGLLGIVQR
jgi:hypothetical protein